MTKQDLISKVAEYTGFTKKDTATVLAALKEVSLAALRAGEDVSVIDGVKLSTVYKEAHIGRNPATGESIQIAAKNAPKAKFTPKFKAALNS